jgi:hypothetical protein
MQIFQQEINDKLEHKITSSASFSYASIAEPCVFNKPNISNLKSLASFDDSDLYYVQSILVSSSWNKNDDIFEKGEIWIARQTPEDKPTNLEHDESTIIGHITSNWPITEEGTIIPENTDINSLPEKYHILTGSVIYRAFTSPELKERAEKLIASIESGEMFVSMECFFKGFDYGIVDKTTGTYRVLSRNENTAYLTKYLRAYGGMGEHDNYKIGRVLRNITFSGKGFVEKPANPDSVIFTKDIINRLFNKKNDDLSNSGVFNNQSTSNVENINMSDNTDTSAQATETTPEVNVQGLQDQITVLQTQVAAQTEIINTLETEKQEAAKKVKEEKEKEEAAKKMKEDEMKKEEAAKKMAEDEMKKEEAFKKMAEDEEKTAETKKLKAELETAMQTIAEYMKKEEEANKKAKKMARKASLLTYGFDDSSAEAAVEKFDNLSDEAFNDMTSLFAGKMPPWLNKDKKDDEETDTKKESKKASIENTVDSAVLDNVEVEPSVNLSVGSDEASSVDSTRAELVEFVYARLGKKLNKGE